MEVTTFKEALTAVKVAIVSEGFPGVQLEQERLKAVQKTVVAAYEKIPMNGPQVRFVKCTIRTGHLVVACADETSSEWLSDVVPSLKPLKDATLRTLG